MSKTIKISEPTYNNLDLLRGKGETFSQVIEDLLMARAIVLSQLGELEHRLKYWEWQQEENYARAHEVTTALHEARRTRDAENKRAANAD